MTATRRQACWAGSCVAVCGLGGLGSHVAVALARSGVGELLLIDDDRVDLSNIHRQQYTLSQVGQYKTEAMRQTLQGVAPDCRVTTHTIRFCEEDLPLLAKADVVCEAFDTPENKAMLVGAVLEGLPDCDLVAASGMAGLQSGNDIRTRRVSRRFWLCGDERTDVAEEGRLYAPRVMLCAAQQALTILQILAGEWKE